MFFMVCGTAKRNGQLRAGSQPTCPHTRTDGGERDGKNFARRVGRLSACKEAARTVGEGTKRAESVQSTERRGREGKDENREK